MQSRWAIERGDRTISLVVDDLAGDRVLELVFADDAAFDLARQLVRAAADNAVEQADRYIAGLGNGQ